MIFFYEMLFVAVALGAAVIAERVSANAALIFLLGWWAFIWLGYASFGARLALGADTLGDEEQRWYRDARDGLRHLRLLFGLAVAVALIWRLFRG